MCLGVPGRIVEIDGNEARAEFWNVEKRIRLDIVGEEVEEGDYILNHVGYAIRRIPEAEVEATLELFESVLEGAEGDVLAEDVTDELETGMGPVGPTDEEKSDLLEELGIDD